MLNFKDYQTTQPTPPAAHLAHLEDLVFDGPASVSFVVDVLKEFGTMLEGGTTAALNVSTKWDGSPAVVFGPDPADKQFFVATKSAFSKMPKLAKTHDDIDAMYSNERVRIVLHQALDELAPLQPEHVLQGDVLFAKGCPTDMRGAVREQEIDGTAYLTFQPNTILYAVDKDSALGQHVLAAKFGIVIHTAFTGTGQYLNTFKRKNVSPLTYSLLQKTPDVLTLDANYDDVSGTATFTAEEAGDFLLALSEVQETGTTKNNHPIVYDIIDNTANLRRLLRQFVNDRVRQSDGAQFYDFGVLGFLQYLDGQQNRESGEKLTERGRESVRKRYAEISSLVMYHRDRFTTLFRLHLAVQRAKIIIIRKLSQASDIRSFLPTPSGFKVSGPEGFVAVSHSGQAVKLVDRLEFSRTNFQHRDTGN
jgi:hypothetical protein